MTERKARTAAMKLQQRKAAASEALEYVLDTIARENQVSYILGATAEVHAYYVALLEREGYVKVSEPTVQVKLVKPALPKFPCDSCTDRFEMGRYEIAGWCACCDRYKTWQQSFEEQKQ